MLTTNPGRAGLFALAILVTVTGGAIAKPTTVTAEVNLRDMPTTSAKVLALIPKGTAVEVSTCTNGWCQISFNGQQGYAISRNLGIAPPPVPRRVVRHGPPQVYAGGPPPYDPGPIYVGPGPYPYPYYGYYGPYFGPRWGWGWRRGWGFRVGW